jgi:hypothetical protein
MVRVYIVFRGSPAPQLILVQQTSSDHDAVPDRLNLLTKAASIKILCWMLRLHLWPLHQQSMLVFAGNTYSVSPTPGTDAMVTTSLLCSMFVIVYF